MKLPPGSTGFVPSPGASTDLRAFTAACHHAARAIDATVTGVTPAGVTPTFHTVGVADARHHIAVLRHTTVPFIAFARRYADGEVELTYVDHPNLAAALADLTDARPLTAAQLDTSLSQVDLSALSRHEHHQINYWKPTTVGELLFNFWD